MGKSIRLYQNLERVGMVDRIPLSQEELKNFSNVNDEDLPYDIFTEIDAYGKRQYYRYPIIPDQEINTRLNALNALNILAIKKCVIFFTTITIIILLIMLLRGC